MSIPAAAAAAAAANPTREFAIIQINRNYSQRQCSATVHSATQSDHDSAQRQDLVRSDHDSATVHSDRELTVTPITVHFNHQ